jgi:hypothetical protein
LEATLLYVVEGICDLVGESVCDTIERQSRSLAGSDPVRCRERNTHTRAFGRGDRGRLMPRSLIDGKAWLSHVVPRRRPASVLDVGPGLGTYSDLLRAVTPRAYWSCVEVFAPYVDRFALADKYDLVHVADIRVFAWPQEYDVVILGDVLEHMPLLDALDVWAAARAHARQVVLSIPIVDYSQGPQHGNPHEAHVHTWSHADVVRLLPGITCWRVFDRIAVYLATGGTPALRAVTSTRRLNQAASYRADATPT